MESNRIIINNTLIERKRINYRLFLREGSIERLYRRRTEILENEAMIGGTLVDREREARSRSRESR